MSTKVKDKLDRMQRKSSRPMGRGERVRQLRPAHDGAAPAERPARQPRDDQAGRGRSEAPRGDAPRGSRSEGARGDAPRGGRSEGARGDAPRGGRSEAPRGPRSEGPRGDKPTRGTPVAERPSDTAKRPAKPAGKRPAPALGDAPSGKRRGPASGDGQRPGFGRRKPKPD